MGRSVLPWHEYLESKRNKPNLKANIKGVSVKSQNNTSFNKSHVRKVDVLQHKLTLSALLQLIRLYISAMISTCTDTHMNETCKTVRAQDTQSQIRHTR